MAKVYILQLSDGSYYIGSTENLERRLIEHNKGKNKSTKNKRPFILKYSEDFPTRGEAQSREYQIKGWKSRKAIERLFSS